jgi:hypothetical protein
MKNILGKYINNLSTTNNIEIIISSGELNIFVYREDTTNLRKLLEEIKNKNISCSLKLYIYRKILFEKGIDTHPMVDAINALDNKKINILQDKKIDTQFLYLNIDGEKKLYIYTNHEPEELNYKYLSSNYSEIDNISHIDNIRDMLEVYELDIDSLGYSNLYDYINELNNRDIIIESYLNVLGNNIDIELTTMEEQVEKYLSTLSDKIRYAFLKNNGSLLEEDEKQYFLKRISEDLLNKLKQETIC